jgi:hypothetical protein
VSGEYFYGISSRNTCPCPAKQGFNIDDFAVPAPIFRSLPMGKVTASWLPVLTPMMRILIPIQFTWEEKRCYR